MHQEFENHNTKMIAQMSQDESLRRLSSEWLKASVPYQYTYHFTWLGRPMIQLPQDIVALQEVIWKVKPKWIIETGVAHGGSLVFSASMLELIGEGGRVV